MNLFQNIIYTILILYNQIELEFIITDKIKKRIIQITKAYIAVYYLILIHIFHNANFCFQFCIKSRNKIKKAFN